MDKRQVEFELKKVANKLQSLENTRGLINKLHLEIENYKGCAYSSTYANYDILNVDFIKNIDEESRTLKREKYLLNQLLNN